MRYVESPEILEDDEWNKPSVFLAGGITGCPDWQTELVKLLGDADIIIVNPRRENFPIDDPDAALAQIKWEFEMLRKVTVISFWFSAEGVQPIAMYELGAWSMGKYNPIVVGVEPGFWREADVRIQTNFVRPLLEIHDNLEAMAENIIKLLV